MSRYFPEVSITVQGQPMRLVLDINALAVVEEQLSTPAAPVTIQDLANQATAGSVRAARWLFWAALQRHHPDTTIEQAGDIISEVGPAVLGDLLQTATPDGQDVKALGLTSRRPRKAQAAS